MKVFVEIQGQTFLTLTTLSDPLKLRDHERFPLLLSSVGKPGSDLPCGLSMQRIRQPRRPKDFLCKIDNVVIFPIFHRLWQCASGLIRNWRMNEQNQRKPDAGNVGSQQCRIQRAVTLMETYFAAKLSRKEMARAAGLSVSHFSKLFAQRMGLSPHQYLVRCRLRHAKKLLLTLDEGLSIVDVAAEAGFADQAHFSRHFRRAYGVSPLAFRRTARGESETPISKYVRLASTLRFMCSS